MRKLIITAAVLIFGGFVFYSCSDDSSSPDNNTNNQGAPAENYMPGGLGTTLVYRVDTVNTSSGASGTTGTRTAEFDSTANVGGTDYIVQSNTVEAAGLPDSLPDAYDVFYRRNDNGIYILVDTTGLSELSEMIPDSLTGGEDDFLQIDHEIIMLSTPLYEGKTWTAFQLNVVYGPITYSIADVKAYYEGAESIPFEPDGGTRTAEKIRYILTVQIPNTEDISNPYKSEFELISWMVPGIGVVKAEGNALLLSTFGEGEVDLSDSSISVRQTLTSYNIVQ